MIQNFPQNCNAAFGKVKSLDNKEEKQEKNSFFNQHPLICCSIVLLLGCNLYLGAALQRSREENALAFQQIQLQLSSVREEMSSGLSQSVGEFENILARQASMISDFNYHIQPEKGGRIRLMLSATVKSHREGQNITFTLNADGAGPQRVRTSFSDNVISSQLVLPLAQSISVGLLVSDEYTSRTETITELKNIPQGLTSHLAIRPSISIESANDTGSARVSGEVYLINSIGQNQNRSLTNHTVDIVYNDTVLHTIDFVRSTEVGSGSDEIFTAQIQPYPVPVDSPGTLTLVANATDMEGFTYRCVIEKFEINDQREVLPVSDPAASTFTITN